MNAVELFHQDGRPSGVFYCEKCRGVRSEKEQAENCCKEPTCSGCGTEISKYWTKCDACREKEEAAREAALFEAAEKVTTWDGWIYVEGLGYRDGFFESVDDLLDFVGEGEEDQMPEYAWTCDSYPFAQVSIEEIKERIEDSGEAYEDFDANDLDGLKELEAALDAFNKANEDVVSWTPNLKRALVLKKEVACG